MTDTDNITKQDIEQIVIDWTTEKISSNFEFRPHQLETICDIVYNILTKNEHSKQQIIEAPTGSGKSLINIISAGVLADYFDKTSYILCSDLFLFDQYDSFFKSHPKIDMVGLKGQTGNYKCKVNKEDFQNGDCKISNISWNILLNKRQAKEHGYECALTCPYCKLRNRALDSRVVLITYQLYFNIIKLDLKSQTKSPYSLHAKDILFCDECHNIPSIIQNQYTFTINKKSIKAITKIFQYYIGNEGDLFAIQNLDNDNIKELYDKYTVATLEQDLMDIYKSLLNDNITNDEILEQLNKYSEILDMFTDLLEESSKKIADKQLSSEKDVLVENLKIHKLNKSVKQHIGYLYDFLEIIKETGSEFFVKQLKQNEDKTISIVFNCTKEDFLIYKYLLNTSQNQIMLSATIGGKDAYIENIGARFLGEDTATYSVIPSYFDFEQSPIYFFNRYKMSYQEKNRSLSILKNAIYQICTNKFNENRGIIQTGSYEIAKYIYDNAPKQIRSRMLLYSDSKEKDLYIKLYKNYDNKILLGPTLVEGIDFPGDLCRFIIILKVPYPSLADKLVQAKMKLFPLWYKSITSNEIIQGIGRGVRYNGDYCTTYILDACFAQLYMETKSQYSEDLQKRIKVI